MKVDIPEVFQCDWIRFSARKVLSFCNEINKYIHKEKGYSFDLTFCVEFPNPTYEINESVASGHYYGFDKFYMLEDFYQYIFEGKVLYALSENEFYRPYLIDEFHFLLSPGSNISLNFKRFYEEDLFDEKTIDFIESIKTSKILSGEKEDMASKSRLLEVK